MKLGEGPPRHFLAVFNGSLGKFVHFQYELIQREFIGVIPLP